MAAAISAVSSASTASAVGAPHDLHLRTVALGGPTEPVLGATARSRAFTMHQRWAREVTRYGDADTSVFSIEHVTELQYRLRWIGVYHAGITGHFGVKTRKAVKLYQKHQGFRATGVAGHRTWAHLLRQTVRHPGRIPHICKTSGWHACYDRSMHQVTLWRNGVIWNTWLVRGGDSMYPTRLGNTKVYLRDKNHVSTIYGTPMPYSQFFDGGQALHGSVFMMDPFVDHSHGCVNMYLEDARQLWRLTSTKRLYVSVYGAWD